MTVVPRSVDWSGTLDAPCIAVDGDGLVVAVGPGVPGLLNRSSEALVGARAGAAFLPEDGVALDELVRHVAASRSPTVPPHARCRLHATGPGAREIEVVVHSPPGLPGGIGAVLELRPGADAERASPGHEALGTYLRKMLRFSQDTVLVVDALGRIRDVFGSHEREAGWTREALIGRFGPKLVHPDDRPEAVLRLVANVLDPSRRGNFTFEARLQAADGSYRWAEFMAANEFADPMIRGLVVTARHLTPVKAVQSTLRESEARLATALWAAKAATWSVDVAAARAYMSAEFFDLTGIPAEAWARERNPWSARTHPDDRERVHRAYERVVAGGEDLYEAEYRLLTPTGWLWLHDRGRVVIRDAEGRAVRVAGTSLDATTRKDLERALAEATGHERLRLSYDLHDGLGQELTGIQFMLAGLARELEQGGSRHARDVRDVLALVHGAIETTRSLAHGLVPDNVARRGLRGALDALARDLERGFGLRISIAGTAPADGALSDEVTVHLYRIVQEAVANARRHGAATRVNIAIAERDGGLELSIADDGTGIEADAADGGAGIGLRTMAHRAQQVGGDLRIERRPEGGTRLVVLCPLRRDRPDRSGSADGRLA